MPTNILRWQFALLIVSVLAAGAKLAEAQPAPPAQAGTPADVKPFKPEELEQIAAPIALYPDSVVAQVLMASTYPLEIVQANRWVIENKDLKGDALTAALEKNNWDPSIKSLVNFPQVLAMMSKQLDWTTKLGDAFIADQKAVMNAVQKLRAKAQAEGNLKDTAEQKVIVEQAQPAQTVIVQGSPPPPQIIKIESASPEVVYVPTYDPTVVYGAWPYPAYPPPPPYYPPGYVASSVVSFGAGVAVGAAWGYAWGGCQWGRGNVDVNVNQNANINGNINRQSYSANIQNRNVTRQGDQNTFQHDPAHRKAVSYRDQATAKQLGLPQTADAAKARDSFRGRAETGRQDIARGGADQITPRDSPGRAGSSGSPGRPDAGRLDSSRAGTGANRVADNSPTRQDPGRAGSAASRSPSNIARDSAPSASRSGAFDSADRGGAAARNDSSRGQASRSSSSARSSASPARSGGGDRGGGGGGGDRGGGGGGRGGGGGGGGRGGGGRR